ncbi:TPA: hypothetical protein EYP26_03865, partial [Candidatus Bathyarchaeota archaeon]|nr:hypothetical protein [Candidatus Bathyarchaeota archaeon]
EKLRGGCEVEWKVFCNEELAKKLFNLSYPAEFNPDPYRWLVESDAVITLAGLSSLVELAYLKKRAIIAYIANDFEQMGNALEFEGREGYRVFNLSRVEATDLQAALIGILREEPKPPSVKDASNEIAKEILETNTRN